jgi:SAM-dependent methyltransferase
LIGVERKLVSRALSGRFGTHLVQLDSGLHAPLFEPRLYGCGLLMTQSDNRALCPTVRGDAEALPFETESLDALIMHHTLDQCDNPYQAVREAAQALRPGGILVIVGFNPYSSWGLRALFNRSKTGVWRSRFISSSRVADWMQLLNFELERSEKHGFMSPFSRPAWLSRLRFLGRIQQALFPVTGSVYLLVGCKQIPGRINGRARWRAKPILESGLAGRTIRKQHE